MINVSKGDRVLIRDVLKCRERFVSVMVAGADVIITADDANGNCTERFDSEGWNASRTHRIVDCGHAPKNPTRQSV